MGQKANEVEGHRRPARSAAVYPRFATAQVADESVSPHFLKVGIIPMYRTVLIAGVIGIVLSQGVSAQTRLPRNNPNEQQVREINRSLQYQERRRLDRQQTQVEINQMRQELNRRQNFRSLPGPGPGLARRICAPGQISC
jgi:hypothetical protein